MRGIPASGAIVGDSMTETAEAQERTATLQADGSTR